VHLTAGDEAARNHVLGGELNVCGSVCGNAEAVAHGLDGAKGPARAARALVADVPDRGAGRPGRARVKSRRSHVAVRVVGGRGGLLRCGGGEVRE
jgi:hypothetical protein